jgi:hypothetical protein
LRRFCRSVEPIDADQCGPLTQADFCTMALFYHLPSKWLPIATAPSGSDLRVCVIDKNGIHSLVFPCRKEGAEWVDPLTKQRIDIRPTHWRLWSEDGRSES